MDFFGRNGPMPTFSQNQYLYGGLIMFLLLYGSFAQQTLPDFMYKLFDNRIFLFVIFFSVFLVGSQNYYLAFILALIFGVLMHNFNQKKITEAFLNGLKTEGFETNIPIDFDTKTI